MAFQIQDAGQLANTPVNQLTPNISLPTNPYLYFGNQSSSQNYSQLLDSLYISTLNGLNRIVASGTQGFVDGANFTGGHNGGLNPLQEANYIFGQELGLGFGIGSLLIPDGIEIDAARLSAAGNTLVNYAKNQIDALTPYFLNKLSLFADNTDAQEISYSFKPGQDIIHFNQHSGQMM